MADMEQARKELSKALMETIDSITKEFPEKTGLHIKTLEISANVTTYSDDSISSNFYAGKLSVSVAINK